MQNKVNSIQDTSKPFFINNHLDLRLSKTINIPFELGILQVLYLQHQSLFATCSRTDKVIIWSKKTFRPIRTLYESSHHVHYMLQLSRQILATVSLNHNIKLWNIYTGKCIATLEGNNHILTLYKVSDRYLLSGGADHNIRLWDISDLQKVKCELYALKDAHGKEHGYCLCITHLEEDTFCCGGGNNIFILKLSAKKFIKVLKGHEDWINRIIKLDETRIISGSYDLSIRVWNWKQSICLHALNTTEVVYDIMLLENMSMVSSGKKGVLHLWDVNTLTLKKKVKAHENTIYHLSRTLNRELITTTCGFGYNTIKFWVPKYYKP